MVGVAPTVIGLAPTQVSLAPLTKKPRSLPRATTIAGVAVTVP